MRGEGDGSTSLSSEFAEIIPSVPSDRSDEREDDDGAPSAQPGYGGPPARRE